MVEWTVRFCLFQRYWHWTCSEEKRGSDTICSIFPCFFLWSKWKKNIFRLGSWPGQREDKQQAGTLGCELQVPPSLPICTTLKKQNRTHFYPYCQGLEQRWLSQQGQFHSVSINWVPTVYRGCTGKRPQEFLSKRQRVGKTYPWKIC